MRKNGVTQVSKGGENMRYPNLRAEMARQDVSAAGLAMYTGLSTASVYRRLRDGGFSIEEAQRIQERLFPAHSIDYLFGEIGGDESGQDRDVSAGG